MSVKNGYRKDPGDVEGIVASGLCGHLEIGSASLV